MAIHAVVDGETNAIMSKSVILDDDGTAETTGLITFSNFVTLKFKFFIGVIRCDYGEERGRLPVSRANSSVSSKKVSTLLRNELADRFNTLEKVKIFRGVSEN